MKQNWLDGELKKVFTLSAEEKIMARGMSKSYQVLFLALYKACKAERVTPNKIPKFSPNVTDFISDQLGIQHVPIGTIPSRSKRHLLQQIRENLTFGKLSTGG